MQTGVCPTYGYVGHVPVQLYRYPLHREGIISLIWYCCRIRSPTLALPSSKSFPLPVGQHTYMALIVRKTALCPPIHCAYIHVVCVANNIICTGLAFTNQTNVFEIVREMKEPSKKRNKQLIHMYVPWTWCLYLFSACQCSLRFCCCLCKRFCSTTLSTLSIYILISVPAYLRFGGVVCDDILLNFQQNHTNSSACQASVGSQSVLDQALVLVGILSMTMSMVLSAPILIFPSRMCLHELLRECLATVPGIKKLGGTFWRVSETLFILGAVRTSFACL